MKMSLFGSRSLVWVSIMLGCLPVIAQAPSDVRLALVIGNSAYPSSPLRNPVNDSTAMALALGKLGFKVSVVKDAKKSQIQQELDNLQEKARGQQAVVAIYFAGHGVQAGDNNYIVPIDAEIRNETDIQKQSIDVTQAIERFSSDGGRLNLLILDACRDNPFKPSTDIAGLAPKVAPKRTFVAYATEAGNVARDGDGDAANGLYTAFLLKELAKPSATIDDVFKRVRFSVWRASGGSQIPGFSNGTDEGFGFESGFESKIASVEDRTAQFAKEKAHWDRVRRSAKADDFFDFIDAYPDSAIGELAQATLERLARRKIITQVARGEQQQNPSDSRFRKGDAYRVQVSVDGVTQPPVDIKVVNIDDDRAQYSGVFGPGTAGESTLAGAVVNDGYSTFDPPYVLVPGGDFQVGKRWHGRSLRTFRVAFNGAKAGETQWMDYSAKIVGKEKVAVPAGTFETYKIEFDFLMENGTATKAMYWAQPEWGIAVKNTAQYKDQKGVLRTLVRVTLDRQRGL